jgi:hypothetical protein
MIKKYSTLNYLLANLKYNNVTSGLPPELVPPKLFYSIGQPMNCGYVTLKDP